MSKFALIAAAFAGLGATAVFAQTTPPPASPTPPAAATPAPNAATAPAAASPAAVNYRKVCGKEIRQVCGPSPKGDKQARTTRRECVVANKAKFTADCQAAIDARETDRLANKDARRQMKNGGAEKPKL